MSQNKQSKATEQPSANKWCDIAEEEAGLSASESTDTAADQASGHDEVAALDEISKKKLTDLTNKLEREIDEYKNEALRAKAETENMRRRLERDIANAHKYGSERLILDLLPVIDGLVRGLEESQADDPKVQSLHQGMELTLDLLVNTLKKNGVSEINPQTGDAFDPALHEAVTMQPNADVAPNTVLQVLQRGYSLNGRVVRAAMVIVSS